MFPFLKQILKTPWLLPIAGHNWGRGITEVSSAVSEKAPWQPAQEDARKDAPYLLSDGEWTMKCQIWFTPLPTWAFIPILCSFWPLINPFIPFSTKKRLMPWAGDRASRLVMATTITRSLNQPLVMNTCKNPNALWCPVIFWSMSKAVLVGAGACSRRLAQAGGATPSAHTEWPIHNEG